MPEEAKTIDLNLLEKAPLGHAPSPLGRVEIKVFLFPFLSLFFTPCEQTDIPRLYSEPRLPFRTDFVFCTQKVFTCANFAVALADALMKLRIM